MSAQSPYRDPRTTQRRARRAVATVILGLAACFLSATLVGRPPSKGDDDPDDDQIVDGRQIFRFDTFGDEQLWTDRLKLHQVIEESLDPLTALELGLKVDVDALPDEVLAAIAMGEADLTDPATTLALIKLDAVVGIAGTVEPVGGRDRLVSVGITCALCHSTVDDSFAPGIGRRAA
jgi:hypothetical protein